MKLLVLCLVLCAATASEENSEWSSYNGRLFQFFTTPSIWPAAQKHCVGLGGSLASVHSRDEEEFVKKVAGGKVAWIGLSDAQVTGQWLWINSYGLDFKNWCKGQPSNWKGSQHCVTVNYTDEKCWDDVDCRVQLPFVCVKKNE